MLVVCFGMMRSGSTWHYNLVSRVVEGRGLGTREGFYARDEWPAIAKRFEKWATSDELRVIKVHELFPFEQLPFDGVRFLMIHRNPIDVARSAYRIWSQDIRESIVQIDRSLQAMAKLSHDKRALVQTYEQLRASPASIVRDLCRHLDIPVEQEETEQIVEETEGLAIRPPPLGRQLLRLSVSFGRRIGLVGALGAIARALPLPQSLYMKLRRYTYPHDPITLYQRRHVAKGDERPLSERDLKILCEHYAEYLRSSKI